MQMIMKRSRALAVVLVMGGLLVGCAQSESQQDTTRRTLSGAAIGTAAGAVVGELATGQPLHGAAVGAAAGAVGGWLFDRHRKEEETPGY